LVLPVLTVRTLADVVMVASHSLVQVVPTLEVIFLRPRLAAQHGLILAEETRILLASARGIGARVLIIVRGRNLLGPFVFFGLFGLLEDNVSELFVLFLDLSDLIHDRGVVNDRPLILDR